MSDNFETQPKSQAGDVTRSDYIKFAPAHFPHTRSSPTSDG